MLKTLAALIASATIIAAPVAPGAEPPVVDKAQPVRGVQPKCGIPPPIPGEQVVCMFRPSDGRAHCLYDVGRIEDGMGMRWQLLLVIASLRCGAPWVPIELKGIPLAGQVVPGAKETL